jgi:uncharacterized membrane protein YkoI
MITPCRILLSQTVVSVVLLQMACTSQAETKVVPLSSLTEKLQEAVKRQVGSSSLTRVEIATEEDEKTFEVVFQRDGKERTATLSDDGKVISTRVFETELPPTVRQILDAEFKDLKPAEIYHVTEDEDPYFEFNPGGNATNSLYIAEAGAWWSLEISPGEAPAPVRATMQKELGPGNHGSLSKTKEGGKIYYEVETTTKDDHDLTLNIAPDGKLLSREEEVDLTQVTPEARKTIQTRVVAGKLLSLTKRTTDKGEVFDVEVERDGRKTEFTVGPRGRIRND